MATNELVELRSIEIRIAAHVQNACQNLLDVGRCLCEVRDKNLVQHGQWEAWVREHTGMTERGAQRLMQAARSAPEGSTLSRLPVSKITAILSLPEPEREGMAQRAADENLTLRELQREIEDQRRSTAAAQKELSVAKENANRLFENLRIAHAQNGQIDQLRHEAERECARLRKCLEEEIEKPRENGISPEAQNQIDDLKSQLADAEEYAEEQARLRQEAQSKMLSAAMAERPDDPGERFGADALASAVRAFIGSAGVMPHMGPALSRMSNREREDMQQQIMIVRTWVLGAQKALDTVMLEV